MDKFGYKIRPATKGDIQKLLPLMLDFELYESSLQEEKLNRAAFQRLKKEVENQLRLGFRASSKKYFVAESENRKLLGYVTGEAITGVLLKHKAGIGWINELYVLPRWRNQGIGSTLFTTMLKWLRQKKMRHVRVAIHRKSKEIQSIIRKLHFRRIPSTYLYFEKK